MFNVNAIRVFSKNLCKWPHFEIYEMDKYNFDVLCNISDEDWNVSPGGWWRQSEGSNLGYPTNIFTVNGKEIKLWKDYGTEEEWEEAYADDYPEQEISYEEYCKDGRYNYEDIFEYCCIELGASTEKNLSSIFVDIAKYNNISVAELLNVYAEDNN